MISRAAESTRSLYQSTRREEIYDAGSVRPRLKRMKRLAATLAFAFSLAGQTVEPEMTADRPGFRNSTHLVGPGVVQVETGLGLSNEHTLAMEPLIRIGALRWLELRLRAD